MASLFTNDDGTILNCWDVEKQLQVRFILCFLRIRNLSPWFGVVQILALSPELYSFLSDTGGQFVKECGEQAL